MKITKSDKVKIILIIVFFIGTLFAYNTTSEFNNSLNPYQVTEEDPTENHSTLEASQLKISGIEQAEEVLGERTLTSVTRQLYAYHYKKNKLLERQAELVSFTGDNNIKMVVEFTPSKKRLTAVIKQNNDTTNDYDISIEEGSK